MRLVSFSVRNYRSITMANKLPIGDMTILVGPNNQGKSNILQALVTALRIVTGARTFRAARAYRYDVHDTGFVWERDFPIQLQESNPGARSEFTLEFELSDLERTEFRELVGSALSTNLKLTMKLGPSSEADFEVPIQGPAKRSLSSKRREIATFIKNHLDLAYIPPVRTLDISIRIVEQMLSRALSSIESDPEYQEIMVRMHELQRPILENLANGLRETLMDFLPEVRSVELRPADPSERRTFRQPCRVLVDDGTKTDLELKGDGIKSLAAIALMRHSSQTESEERSLILAIEEPESHLHPESIHRLRKVLDEIAKGHQLVITTHSPLLVDSVSVKRNIIVTTSRAYPAKSLADVREVLGVQIADNLISAYLVLLVEGQSDQKIITSWLTDASEIVEKALRQRVLAVEILHGVNVANQVDFLKRSLCNVHVYVDNDEAGRNSIDQALQRGTLESTEYHLSACPGMASAEVEDLISVKEYLDVIKTEYGVLLDVPQFRHNRQKWSGRMKDTFLFQGKRWNEQIEKEIKSLIADIVSKQGISCLHAQRRGSIDALVGALESRLRLH
jgi:putative ATP-dependent endonuclease of OLD family